VAEAESSAFDFEKARGCFLKLLYGNMPVSLSPVVRLAMRSKAPVRLKDYLETEEVRNPFSLTGNPVVVIPIGKTREGLPLGIQVVGRRMREKDLLRAAADLPK